jgi:putative solute:sodium symporter small subunit
MRTPSERRKDHWQRVRRFSLLLLGIWLAVTFSSIWFARELAGVTVFGWPVSFYMAAQGSILAYVAIIGAYAWWMDRLDAQYKAGNDDAQ